MRQPFNVLVPLRSSQGLFNIVGGIIVPHTALQQVTYRFGLRQDAQQTYSLKGDSMYYGPPNTVPYEDIFSYTGSTGPFTLSHTASPYLDVSTNTTHFVLENVKRAVMLTGGQHSSFSRYAVQLHRHQHHLYAEPANCYLLRWENPATLRRPVGSPPQPESTAQSVNTSDGETKSSLGLAWLEHQRLT